MQNYEPNEKYGIVRSKRPMINSETYFETISICQSEIKLKSTRNILWNFPCETIIQPQYWWLLKKWTALHSQYTHRICLKGFLIQCYSEEVYGSSLSIHTEHISQRISHSVLFWRSERIFTLNKHREYFSKDFSLSVILKKWTYLHSK